ncbi:carbon storage regulator [Aequitasia blattaphilus]|uniref:Translational regulator CsrA n=1 Tax=Aequitasia blattaphilus TaxID=2949332 RepID=A0ABT1E9N2_9FIRM|nr:carbon storage regulator [Aequitasia blattaphilus]MCP1102545.1 carbon storage regulator [Aequitasia blattaphilus]MCR8615185.1 carbon storage regulator [Aequitasia blattaphilus]
MLVLQRKKGEELLIGEDVRISITEVTADGVKLAIDAPKDIKILRGELAEAIAVNKEAAKKPKENISKDILKVLQEK